MECSYCGTDTLVLIADKLIPREGVSTEMYSIDHIKVYECTRCRERFVSETSYIRTCYTCWYSAGEYEAANRERLSVLLDD